MEDVVFRLDASQIQEYILAVGDDTGIYSNSSVAPPMAIAAMGVKSLLDSFRLPPGTIHVAQEIHTYKMISPDHDITCKASISQSSQRREGKFLVLEFEMIDNEGHIILDGRTTLIVPGQGE